MKTMERQSREVRDEWLKHMDAFAPQLADAIDTAQNGGDSLPLLHAVIRLLALPADKLIPLTGLRPNTGIVNIEADCKANLPSSIDLGGTPAPEADWRPAFGNLDISSADESCMRGRSSKEVHAAVRALYADKQKVATKILTSNGAAPRCRATGKIMRDMHLRREGPLIRPKPSGPQLMMTTEDCWKKLAKEAGDKNASIDPYGWTASLFFFQRGLKGSARHSSLMWQVARLQAMVGNADVPMAVALLLVTGTLTAINKLPHADQLARMQAGNDPKLRPVNSGAAFAKTPLRCAATSPSGTRATKRLMPYQKGCGAPAGPESVAHTMRLLARKGWAILSDDQVNAFNALGRNEMLKRNAELWPESVALCNLMYGFDAPVLYFYRESDGSTTCLVFRSAEGSRMGDVLGTKLFNNSVHPTYATLADENRDLVIRALTDDAFSGFPPPNDGDWQAWFDRITAYLIRMRDLNSRCGLQAHPDKGVLLLPPDAPLPPPDHPLCAMTNITHEGILVAGVAIGSANFMAASIKEKLDQIQSRIESTLDLAQVNRQAAFKILGESVNKALDYYVRTTPPHLISDGIKDFDLRIEAAARTILLLDGYSEPIVSAVTSERAISIRTLPCVHGGAGHISADTKASCAFIAASIAARAEPVLVTNPELVTESLAPAYERLHDLSAIADFASHSDLSAILPPSPLALATAPPPSPGPDTTTLAARKIQGLLVRACGDAGRMSLRTHLPPAADAMDKNDHQLHVNNHVLLLTSRSQSSRVFQVCLADPHNRVNDIEFVHFTRYQLTLPALIHDGALPAEATGLNNLNHTTALCGGCDPRKPIDAVGNHAAACRSAAKARYALHTNICRTIAHFARRAGASVSLEPSTKSLLLNTLTKDQCRVLFPKKPSRVSRELTAKLGQLITKVATMAPGPLKDEAAREAERFAANIPFGTKGLRIDIDIEFNDCSLWIDAAGIHPTATSQFREVHKFNARVSETEKALGAGAAKEAHLHEPSPCIAKTVKRKTDLYAPLLSAGRAHALSGLRKTAPQFHACILSHLGEMSSGLVTVIETVTRKFGELAAAEHLHDGVSLKRKTGAFRSEFKNALMAVNARGFGRAIGDAGRSWVCAGDLLNTFWECVPEWERDGVAMGRVAGVA